MSLHLDDLSNLAHTNHAYHPEVLSSALVAMTVHDPSDSDACAGFHMTNDASILSNVRSYRRNI